MSIRVAVNEGSVFAEEILADLIQQGYSGDALLAEFKNISQHGIASVRYIFP